ncbi:MAG: hypothetical protein RI897_892 [Verrucomicrobiota bacterium]|jgi:cbb3-type cytochrome oxidase cytochrome c subunit
MNHGPLIFLGLLTALATSWFGMIVQPQLQLGRATQSTNILDTAVLYPNARPGQAQQGEEIYRSLGCVTCHSQQVRQDGLTLNVVLKSAGTNTAPVVEALHRILPDIPMPEAGRMLESLPAVVLSGMKDADLANAHVKALNDAGGKAQVQLVAQGADIDRGWGQGRSVAADYLFARTAMPGAIRLGPDLANSGVRLPFADWHYAHLYDPKSVITNSVMPAYRFLFDVRPAGRHAHPRALKLNADAQAKAGEGMEVIPTDDAVALVAYLLSLRSDVPLIERPISSGADTESTAGVSTNAAPVSTNSPTAG